MADGDNIDKLAEHWATAEILTLGELVAEFRASCRIATLRHEALLDAVAGMPKKRRKTRTLDRPVGATSDEARRVHELVDADLAELARVIGDDPAMAGVNPILEVRCAARRWADQEP